MIFKSKTDPLGLRQHDPLQRWRDDAQRREEEVAEARCKEEEEARGRQEAAAAYEAGLLRNAHEARIAALEQKNAALEADLLELAHVFRDAIERVADQRVDLSREQREELRDLKTEVAKLGSTLAELRGGTDFRFAREKDAVADLLDFLAPRRVVN
jgi:hypothetical protein